MDIMGRLSDPRVLEPVSFSVWRTPQNAMTFGYRDEGHRAAVARLRRSQRDVVDRFSSGRFERYRCEGTWNGRTALGLPTSAR
jgi:hypothetical protein